MVSGPDGVALGFRFHPSDEELVDNLLRMIVVDHNPIHQTTPYDTVLNSEDLFDTKEPWEIWEEYGGDGLALIPHLYFCCELKTVTKNGSRINRKVGKAGTWSEGPSSKTIFDSTVGRNPVGRKRNLRYENTDPKHPHHAKWFLDEYSILVPVDEEKPNSRRQRNTTNNTTHTQPTKTIACRFVICRLRKSDRAPQPTPNKTVLNNNKKRNFCSIKDKEQPPLVNTEEEIMETTPSKKMRSDSEDDGYQLVVMESQGVFSEYLPDLSNIDLETEINWDFDPLLFEQCDFGKLDSSGDLQVLDQILSCPAEEPAIKWW